MTLDEIIRNLEDQAQDRESSIDKDDPDCIFRKDAEALREVVGIIRQKISIETRLREKQHQQLKGLRAKLDEVLYHEPADSGSEVEDSIWEQANTLKATLDDFFEEEGTHDN